MQTVDFGGLLWLPFAALGLSLALGYVIWRLSNPGGARRPRQPRSRLEDELQREINAASRRAPGPAETLEPPPEERLRQRALAESVKAIDETKPAGKEESE